MRGIKYIQKISTGFIGDDFMPEVITLGETMVLFSPMQSGPLRYVHNYQKRIAGAESNVAIGIARLGHSSGWISKVGADEFGMYLLREVQAEGVDVSRVKTSDQGPTGVMFKEIAEARETKVFYYRKDSAASLMTPADLDPEYIRSAKILHLTGITPALSQTCLDTIMEAVALARKSGILVSFDPNIRLKLWTKEKASEGIRSILPLVDLVFPGLDEAEIIFGPSSIDRYIDSFHNLGVKIVALKTGGDGCYVSDATQSIPVKAFSVKKVVDPIGAGDAFAAGFLTGILEKKSLLDSAKLANAMGAFAVTTAGDIEGLPERNVLESFINQQTDVFR